MKKPGRCSFPSRLTYNVAPMPFHFTYLSVTIHTSGWGIYILLVSSLQSFKGDLVVTVPASKTSFRSLKEEPTNVASNSEQGFAYRLQRRLTIRLLSKQNLYVCQLRTSWQQADVSYYLQLRCQL